jgi:hypothetical protein
MALISCPDCKYEVSNLAPACHKCGRPIAQIKNIAATKEPLTTTQLTSKKYKVHAVISSILALFGAPMFLIPAVLFSNDGNFEQAFTFAFFGVAIMVYWLFIKMKIWWHHE